MEKWKEELTTLLENGCTDSDIEDFVQKHKGTDGRWKSSYFWNS